jgi:hypothetical protein
MGWVVTLKQVSNLGPKGTVRYVDASSERVLLALGLAEGTTDPRLAPKPKPKRTYTRKDQAAEPEAPKPKRTYKRKDMVAEESVEVVIQAQELEPEPEPQPQTDGDDETTVRV